jgi:hypothetical protein
MYGRKEVQIQISGGNNNGGDEEISDQQQELEKDHDKEGQPKERRNFLCQASHRNADHGQARPGSLLKLPL